VSGADPLVEIDGLSVDYGAVRAVRDVSFSVRRNKVVGLVGESGSGKTTVGRAILRLTQASTGRILFEGTDILTVPEGQFRPWRRRMQLVFQDPFASLNPRMSVGDIIGEALDTHGLAAGRRNERIAELLTQVGLAAEHRRRFPHEFSGGQRQRIGIARALAVEPEFIVADEPVSALDVSVQAQVLNLIRDIQRRLGLTMLFIAHDLAVVDYLCDEVIVMYVGRIMERGPTKLVYDSPRHPYTKALLSAAPVPDPTAARNRVILKGEIPSPIDPPSGCVFRTRCPHAIEACAKVVPPQLETEPGRFVACIRDAELNGPPALSPATTAA
jgi:peptide/nickel transport system ATP-binding protein